MIRVVLVDDQDIVRKGLSLIMSSESDIEVVGEAATGEDAVRRVASTPCDVVLMDVQMPGMDGLEATRQIVASGADTRVLILTTFERDEYIFEALRAGAAGFLLKNAPPEEIIDAIRIVAGGDALLSPKVTSRVIDAFATSMPAPTEPPASLDQLTDREHEVLSLVAEGLSNSEIATALVLGEATIKTHVSSVLSKLHLRDRVQAVVFAHRHGIV